MEKNNDDDDLVRGSPTSGPPGGIMRTAATF